TASNRAATSLGSAALHLWTAAPVSLASAASLSIWRAAMATPSPLRENRRASDALRPGPVPTISAERYFGFSIGASLLGESRGYTLNHVDGKDFCHGHGRSHRTHRRHLRCDLSLVLHRQAPSREGAGDPRQAEARFRRGLESLPAQSRHAGRGRRPPAVPHCQ